MDLETARARIRRIDQQLVALIGDRVEAAIQAGQAKRSAGRPIRDYETERAVVDAMREGVAERDIDPDLGERVARLMIEASLRAQEAGDDTTAAKGPAGRAVVVGGAGAMGRWFADFLNGRGYEVVVSDPAGPLAGYAYESNAARAARGADLVLVSVPPDATGETLETIAATDELHALVIDVASIKGPHEAALRRLAKDHRVASIHPLWGPHTRVLSGKNVLVLDCGNAQAADEAQALFAGTAAATHRLPLGEHDRHMAHTLGLPHAVNLVFSEVLANAGLAFDALRGYGGPTFLKQSAVAAEVASENREMYRQIQRLNPHTEHTYQAVKDAVDALADRIGDPDAFAETMASYDRYFNRFQEWWP